MTGNLKGVQHEETKDVRNNINFNFTCRNRINQRGRIFIIALFRSVRGFNKRIHIKFIKIIREGRTIMINLKKGVNLKKKTNNNPTYTCRISAEKLRKESNHQGLIDKFF